jgi:iron complex outermembrane receptor protein
MMQNQGGAAIGNGCSQAPRCPIDLATRNPVALLELRRNNSNTYRLVGNVQLDYQLHFFPDLHIQANFGLDSARSSGNDNRDSIMATDYKTAGRYQYYQQHKENLLAEVSLFYTKEIKSIRSKVDFLALHGYQDFRDGCIQLPCLRAKWCGHREQCPLRSPRMCRSTGWNPTWAALNYSYNNRYYLTASVRRDASSKFSPETRVGYFPAISAAWKMKDDLFKMSSTVSDLKLRLSWGITGQQDISGVPGASYNPLYPTCLYILTAIRRPSTSSVTVLSVTCGRVPMIPISNGKQQLRLTWASILDSLITGSRAPLNSTRKNRRPAGQRTTGPGEQFRYRHHHQCGRSRKQGMEFVLNTNPVRTKDLSWDFGFNVAYNEVEITNLGPNAKPIPVSNISGGTGNQIGIFAVGYAPFSFNVYKQVYDPGTRQTH